MAMNKREPKRTPFKYKVQTRNHEGNKELPLDQTDGRGKGDHPQMQVYNMAEMGLWKY